MRPDRDPPCRPGTAGAADGCGSQARDMATRGPAAAIWRDAIATDLTARLREWWRWGESNPRPVKSATGIYERSRLIVVTRGHSIDKATVEPSRFA